MRALILALCAAYSASGQSALFRAYHDAGVQAYLAKNYPAAEALFQTAVMEAERSRLADPLVSLAYVALGDMAQARRDDAVAERRYREALAYSERNFGAGSFFSGQALVQLAGLKKAAGEQAEAGALYSRAAAIWERLYDPETETAGDVFRYLGNLYVLEGQWKQAEPLLRDAAALNKIHPGPASAEYAGTLRDLAFLLQLEDRLAEADSLRRQAVTMIEKYFPNDRWRLFGEFQTLGDISKQRGRLPQAEMFYKRGIALSEHLGRTGGAVYARCLAGLAEVYIVSRKNAAQAESMLKDALRIFENQPDLYEAQAPGAKPQTLAERCRQLLSQLQASPADLAR